MPDRNHVKCPVCGEGSIIVSGNYEYGWGMTRDHHCAMVLKISLTVMCHNCGSETLIKGNGWALNDWIQKNMILQEVSKMKDKKSCVNCMNASVTEEQGATFVLCDFDHDCNYIYDPEKKAEKRLDFEPVEEKNGNK